MLDESVTSDSVPPNAVIVIPLGAPLPFELEGALLLEGSLYSRLKYLAEGLQQEDHLVITPLSGLELSQLTSCWETLCTGARPYVLLGLPGTRSDVTFEHAARAIGMRIVEWIDVQHDLESRVLSAQRSSARPPSESTISSDADSELDVKPADDVERVAYTVDRGKKRRSPPTSLRARVPVTDSDDGDDAIY